MKRHQKDYDIAVVVGYHSFQVREFQEFFQSLPGIRCYIQHLEQFTSSPKEVRESYDAVLFYSYRQETPVNDGPWYEGKALDAMNALGETNQGIFVLHHALLAYPEWPLWRELCGISPESFQDYALDQRLDIEPAGKHYVTEGLKQFTITDESYRMGPADAEVEVLLRCSTPGNLPTTAWTKPYRNTQVLCCQLGHGPESWGHPAFRQIVHRGLLWLCEKGWSSW